MKARAYQPRDVVNAPDVKQRIIERSAARGDNDEIAAWLGNHFYRHVIGNFHADAPALQAIHHWREIEAKLSTAAPPWAQRAVQRLRSHAPDPGDNAPVLTWWIDPDSEPLLALEARLLEFLRSRRGTALEGKLQRINCPQALARWTLEHLEFTQRRERGLFAHQPDAVTPILQGEHGVFVEFDRHSPHLRMEMAYESQMMGHCVGQFADRQALTGGYGEDYARACEQGAIRLFSYRSGQAHPHITLSAYVGEAGVLRIDQIKGKQNRPPVERYHADLQALLNHLPTDDSVPHDALCIQLVRRPNALCADAATPAWCHARELSTPAEHLWLLHAHPELLDVQHLQTPLMQWLIAARRDKTPDILFARMPRTDTLRDTLTLAQAG